MSPAVIQLLVLAAIAVFFVSAPKGPFWEPAMGLSLKSNPSKANPAKGLALEMIKGGLKRHFPDPVEMETPGGQSFAKRRKAKRVFPLMNF